VLLINPDGETRNEPRHYSRIIRALGEALGADWFPNGDRNDLMRYGGLHHAAGEAVALRLLIDSGARLETMWTAEVRGWLWLIHCMSILSRPNRNPHSNANEARPGDVLQRAGYSEFRLSRLLDARGETFNALLERTVRRIARFGYPINWSKIAPLVLSHDPESTWAENARLVINRDFLLSAARSAIEQKAAVSGSEPLI
jgi:hypothetical protein